MHARIAPDLHFSVKFRKPGSHIFTNMKMILILFPISSKFGYSATNFWRSLFVEIACHLLKGAFNVPCCYVIVVVLKAFKNKMYGSHYAWIIFGAFSPNQIFPDDSKLTGFVECTSNQLKEAADRYIRMKKLDIRQDNRKTLSGMVSY